MALTKLGKLIALSEAKNRNNAYTLTDLKGISIQKMFIPSKADMDGVSLAPYLLVPPQHFAYVMTTSRNGEKITIAHNTTNDTYIVSSSYVVFSVTATDELLPDYLFMYFNRPEFDRYTRFNSWGSARETFSFDDMCDIEIDLPSIPEQEKVVAVYKAMVANQQAYERGLDDLKLLCDAYVERLRHELTPVKVGTLVKDVDERNKDGQIKAFYGINIYKEFMPTVANTENVNPRSYKVVRKGRFVFSGMQTGRDECIRLGLYRKDEPIIVSPAYSTLEIIDETKVLPEYLFLLFLRKEMDRYGWFISDSSIRANLDWERFCEIEVHLPAIEIQKSIVGIFNAYSMRKEINERLKKQIRDICPILIKGSLKAA